MAESSTSSAVPADLTITSLAGRPRVQTIFWKGGDDVIEADSSDDGWQYASKYEPDTSSRNCATATGVQTLTDSQTGMVYGPDKYFLNPGITKDGDLVFRVLYAQSSDQTGPRARPSLAGASARDAAAFAIQMAEKLGLPIVAEGDHSMDSKGKGKASYSSGTDTKAAKGSKTQGRTNRTTNDEDCGTQQEVLKLFAERWSRMLQQSLDQVKLGPAHGSRRSSECLIINDTDYLECLKSGTSTSRVRKLHYEPEPADRFGSDGLRWINGTSKRYGNTARLPISVSGQTSYTSRGRHVWDFPKARVGVALPTSTENLTGVSPGILDLLDETSDVSQRLQWKMAVALEAADDLIYKKSNKEYSLAKEASLGINTRQTELIHMDPEKKQKFTASLCAVAADDFLKTEFGEGNYPIPAVMEERRISYSRPEIDDRTISLADLGPMPQKLEAIRDVIKPYRPQTEEVESVSGDDSDTDQEEEGRTAANGDEYLNGPPPPPYQPEESNGTQAGSHADPRNSSSRAKSKGCFGDSSCIMS